MLLGQGQQFGTVGSHHLLVGGADTAAAFQALADIRVGKPGAADGLHHDLDLGVSEDGIDRVGKQAPASGEEEKSRTSRMYLTSTGSPARRAMEAALRRQTSSTPLPTVPKPIIAILAMRKFPFSVLLVR